MVASIQSPILGIMTISTPLASRGIACALILSAAALAFTAPVHAEKKKFKAGFRGDLVFDYTDNLYRLSDDELAEFENLQDPGERFFNMPSSDDVIARLRLRGDFDWKVAKKRKVRLMLRGTYYKHQENDIRDYPRFEVALSGDLTKKDALYGSIDLIHDRFWKNLRVAATGLFVPGIYDQGDARLGYVRQLKKRWTLGLEYRYRKRTYEPPLGARDRDGNYLAVSTDYRIAKRFDGGTVLQYGSVTTNTVTLPTSGIFVDRSYDEGLLAQRFKIGFSKHVFLDLALEYRRRNFTTDEIQDVARYDRVDSRWRSGFALNWEVIRNLLLEARFRYTDNDSDRIDPTADSDQLGYTETRYGFGIRYRH